MPVYKIVIPFFLTTVLEPNDYFSAGGKKIQGQQCRPQESFEKQKSVSFIQKWEEPYMPTSQYPGCVKGW